LIPGKRKTDQEELTVDRTDTAPSTGAPSKSARRTVTAPQSDAASPAILSVELEEDEEVQWTWTNGLDGKSVVTGYTIVKKTGKD